MSEHIELKKDKRNLIWGIVIVSLLAITVIFLLIRMSMSDKEYQADRIRVLKDQMEEMRNQYSELAGVNKKLRREGDSLQGNLDVLWPKRALVYNARLRDRVSESLSLKPGDLAYLKYDSSRVVITDIVVGGNQFTYFVNYIIKTSKGETKQVSPFELNVIE